VFELILIFLQIAQPDLELLRVRQASDPD
jgi:hypothetical protein